MKQPKKPNINTDPLYCAIPNIPTGDIAPQTTIPTIYTGKITNAIMLSKDDMGIIKQGEFGKTTEYQTIPLNGISFIKNEKFNNTLNAPTQRLFLFMLYQLGKNISQHETDLNKIQEGTFKPFSLAEYMTMCGLKDKKETIKNIKKSISELLGTFIYINNVSLPINEKQENGKIIRRKKTFTYLKNLIELGIDTTDKTFTGEKEEYLNQCIENGLVYIYFNLEVASLIVNCPMLKVPPQLLKVDIHSNGIALNLGWHLLNLANQKKNKIKVYNAIKACPDLHLDRLYNPSNIVNISTKAPFKDTIRPSKHIIEPFIASLEKLKSANILSDYHLENFNGEKILARDLNKSNLESSYLVFTTHQQNASKTPAIQEAC